MPKSFSEDKSRRYSKNLKDLIKVLKNKAKYNTSRRPFIQYYISTQKEVPF